MVAGNYRNTVAIVDKDAIRWNIVQEKKRLTDEALLYAVVKADGYGHGAVEVAKAAKEAGVDGFCVALLDEAVELREAEINESILILGVVDPLYADVIVEKQLSVTIGRLDWIEKAEGLLRQKSITGSVAVHIALDTGMGRIGFRTEEEVKKCEQQIHKSEHFFLEGVFTHFATADSDDDTLFLQQQERFNCLIKSFDNIPEIVHTANSATTLFHPNNSSKLIRFGIAMYGLNPSGNLMTPPYQLKPALQLKSELIHVKQMNQGDVISYGATYQAEEGEWIGTLPIGYADGWLRKLQGQEVLVNGSRCEIVGRICMDQCMVRLPGNIPVGTEVVLIGKSGQEEITLQEIADKLDTIHYEVACGITPRVKRRYVH
ncbi:alanine racemase [Desemzia sp. RIT804]|uniref:alanine racemase n=1 Tax=Desemzia sp. RIT 804 TaxID=2810209 RepID=UPI00194E782F|nr:alanine racemase [Desemzia sp. RIT 804]MBM6616046.1 alanine racemase [Desemzia sp. RIT 804]